MRGGYSTQAVANFNKRTPSTRGAAKKVGREQQVRTRSRVNSLRLLAAMPDGDQVHGLSHLRWWHIHTKYSPNAVGEGPQGHLRDSASAFLRRSLSSSN